MKSKGWFILLAFLLAMLIGLNIYPLLKSAQSHPNVEYIFWQMRVPTVLITLLAGIILSLTGLNYQYLFQNHLASPYTLGMASAAAFGSSFFLLVQREFPRFTE